MNIAERKELHQDIENYIKAGGTIKVYGEGTGRTKDGKPYGDGPVAKLLYETTNYILPWM